ncbi:MAG: glycosyltransferase family 4 protein, partial [Leptospiraceae bacterium]|nr:glycosyltransferase family 4 protein [Leptospiraceae bacterium]
DHQRQRFLLYLGRIDAGKGCSDLIQAVLDYNRRHKQPLELRLAGSLQLKLPRDPAIQYLGYVSETQKQALLRTARALVMPSLYESLSLVTLEAMASLCPVLVNGRNPVLMEHLQNSGCGAAWHTDEELMQAFAYLQKMDDSVCDTGRPGSDSQLQYPVAGLDRSLQQSFSPASLQAGYKYVAHNFSLEVVQRKLIGLMES